MDPVLIMNWSGPVSCKICNWKNLLRARAMHENTCMLATIFIRGTLHHHPSLWFWIYIRQFESIFITVPPPSCLHQYHVRHTLYDKPNFRCNSAWSISPHQNKLVQYCCIAPIHSQQHIPRESLWCVNYVGLRLKIEMLWTTTCLHLLPIWNCQIGWGSDIGIQMIFITSIYISVYPSIFSI